jgi:hypothetical protein
MHFSNSQNGRGAQCGTCGKPITRNLQGRPKRFCSTHCRNQARSARKAIQRFKNGARYPHSGEPRNDSKGACGTGTFCTEKSGRPPDIAAPKRVIDIELGGLVWRADPEGGCTLVAQLRPPALRNNGGGVP